MEEWRGGRGQWTVGPDTGSGDGGCRGLGEPEQRRLEAEEREGRQSLPTRPGESRASPHLCFSPAGLGLGPALGLHRLGHTPCLSDVAVCFCQNPVLHATCSVPASWLSHDRISTTPGQGAATLEGYGLQHGTNQSGGSGPAPFPKGTPPIHPGPAPCPRCAGCLCLWSPGTAGFCVLYPAPAATLRGLRAQSGRCCAPTHPLGLKKVSEPNIRGSLLQSYLLGRLRSGESRSEASPRQIVPATCVYKIDIVKWSGSVAGSSRRAPAL
jgi:hypothetical protein